MDTIKMCMQCNLLPRRSTKGLDGQLHEEAVCSDGCANELLANSTLIPEVECLHCGVSFQPVVEDSFIVGYCSRDCLRAYSSEELDLL